MIKVIVPQITPGIISGSLIAFTMSVDDFIISYFVTGGGVKNLSIMVYTMSKRVNPSINAISTLVVVIITITLILINIAPVLAAKRRQKDVIQKHSRIFSVAAAACVLVALIFVVRFGNKNNDRPFEDKHSIFTTGENIQVKISSLPLKKKQEPKWSWTTLIPMNRCT